MGRPADARGRDHDRLTNSLHSDLGNHYSELPWYIALWAETVKVTVEENLI
jgi:hypothetical protein